MRKFLLSIITLLTTISVMAVGKGDGSTKANAIDFNWTEGHTHVGTLWYRVDLSAINGMVDPTLALYLTNLSDESAKVNVDVSATISIPVAGFSYSRDIEITSVEYSIAAQENKLWNRNIGELLELNVRYLYLEFSSTQKIAISVENEEIMEAKPIETATCENSQLLNWNSSVKQSALQTKWYEIDLATIKQNDEHLQLTFTNNSDKVVVVMGEILHTCGSEKAIPYVCLVPAGMSVSQVINYNMFALMPHPKHFYVSATVIPTTASSVLDLKDVRSKDDIMVFVPTDLDVIQATEVELVAKTYSAEANPTACNEAVTIAKGVKYEQAAGTTKWYRVTDDLLNKLSLIPDVAFINNGKKAANITIAAGVDCEHSTFGLSTITVPTWADFTMFPSRLVGNLLDKAFNSDVKEMYLQVTTDEPIAFGIDINYGFGFGCDDARKFNWETGAVVIPGDAQWIDFDIASVKKNKQQVKLTLTNESNSLAWVGMMVSLTCPFKVALPTFFAIPAGMSVDKVVDYSYFASTKLDQLYIALITEEKISVKAEAVKAESSASDKLACDNAVVVKNGEAYVHKPGTTWYKFDRSMFSDVARLPKFRYAAEAATTVTFGATVGCEYNIATKGTIKLPTTKGLEVSFRMPGFISEVMDKFVDSEVKEFYLELTTDKQIKFGMDMEYAGGCEKAVALNLDEEINIDLKAGKDAWYQVDLNKIKAMGDKMINLNLMNPSNQAVEVEFEVSPTCPLLVSAIKTVSVPANTNLPTVFLSSTIIKLYDEVIERLNVPEKITNNLPNALKDDMMYYVRIRATGDLHVDNEDNTIERPEGCEDAKELDLSKTINLSTIKTGWYHVDLTPLKNGLINKVSINNDLGKETGVRFDFFRNCEEERSFYAYTHLFKVGLLEQSVPSYALSMLGSINEVYIYITMDVDVLTCEDAIEFDWNKGGVHNAGDTKWYHFDITSIKEENKQVKLTFTNHSNEISVVYGEVALHCPYTKSIPYACVVPAGMSIDKVIDYSVFAASRVEELYVKVYSTKTIELAATSESALVFDQMPCNNSVTVESGREYKHAAGTSWYKLPKSLFMNTGKLPKFYFTTEEEGLTTITLGATVGCEHKILTKTIVKLPGSLNYAMVVPEQMFDLMDKFVNDEVTEVYVEMTTNRAVHFSVDMINDTDDACHSAELLDVNKEINLVANQAKWYKVDIDAFKAMNSDVAVKVINQSAEAATIDMEFSLTCPVVVSLNKSLTVPVGIEATKIISQSTFAKIPGVSFYVRFEAIADVQISFSEPEIPEEICKDAILLNKDSVINLSALNTPGWYKFDLADIHEAKKDLNLSINNDLGRSVFLGLKLYETCETGSFYNLSDSVAEGMLYKTTSYNRIYQAIGTAPELYAYITIDTIPVPPVLVEGCEEAVEYVWGTDLELNAGDVKWYKLAIADLRGKTCDITLTANNASVDTVRATIVMHEDCPVTSENQIVSMEDLAIAPTSIMEKTVSSTDLPGDVDTVYLHVETKGAVTVNMIVNCVEPPVLEFVYDTIYSYACESAMWNDTIHVSETLDSVYTYIVNAFVAPTVMNDSILNVINAAPILTQGVLPNVIGTIDAIKDYYLSIDADSIADVDAIYWTEASLSTKVDCEANLHNMTLVLVDVCGNEIATTHTFKVELRQVVATIIDTTICFGEEFIWFGEPYNATGEYMVTIADQNDCDSIVTLNLTVLPDAIMEDTDTVIYEGQSYTWIDGVTYTETTSEPLYIVQYAGANCDSLVAFLNLTVLPRIIVDTTITGFVCDGTEFIDPITNEKHIISSLISSINKWNDTIVGVTTDTIYSFEITPIVAPMQIDNSILATINGATPILTPGFVPNVTGTIDAIKGYYAAIDNDTIADVNSVYWTDATLETVVACGATIYTMTLIVEDGCDNLITNVFTFEVAQPVATEETAVACGSYAWNGQTYTASGDYTFTTTAANGCDSVVTLHLTINQPVAVEETAVACGSYTWNGQTYTASGDYTFTTTAANGCDSVVTLHLTIKQSVATEETAVACGSYAWNGQTYTASGDYTFTTTAANGCDSVVTLHLTIKQPVAVEETAVACGSYTWNGQTYTASGDYTFTTTAANGCDSVVTLHLTIKQPVATEEAAVACGSYTWNGQTYTASGDYTFRTTAANGCDSVVTLHLTINQPVATEETAVACGSYTWNGQTYTASGDYTFRTTAANGCDSVVTLHLTINQPVATEETAVACGTYTWNGQTYTASGDYTFTTKTVNGCDSIVTLHLTINQPVATEETVVACGSYTWNGQIYTTSGDYTFTTTAANGCDSIVTLHLTINQPVVTEETVVTCGTYTWNGQTYAASGDYTFTTIATNGCDSVVTLHLTILPDVVTEKEALIICESEFPYEWRGETLTAVGTYKVVEKYEGTDCDKVIYELDLQTYVMTLPTNVSMPIAICGNSVDVVDATADIEDHIATTNLYAPNAVVSWYVNNNGNWTLLTNDSIKGGLNDITLKYVITSDCGTIESETFTVAIEVIENGIDVDDVLAISKYENRIFLLHLNDFVDNYGWTPTPEEVTWYKVVNDKDQDVIYDDIQVGKGHSYNEPDGSVIKPGEYYALIISNEMVDPDDCDGQIIMRTITLSSGDEVLSPKLISNVVRPNDNLRLINLDSEEVTEIFVYNMMGELIDTYMVDQASEFIFNANHVSGYYLIDVKTANNKTTLRYIVK